MAADKTMWPLQAKCKWPGCALCCEIIRPGGTVPALSCSFRNPQHPPLLPHSVPLNAVSPPHCHTNTALWNSTHGLTLGSWEEHLSLRGFSTLAFLLKTKKKKKEAPDDFPLELNGSITQNHSLQQCGHLCQVFFTNSLNVTSISLCLWFFWLCTTVVCLFWMETALETAGLF